MPATRSSVVARSAALVAAVLATGTVGYMVIEGAGTLDALYMTAITLTTVGYREVFPLGDAGRVFTMLLALGGIGVIFVIATNLARAMLDTDVRRLIGLRRDMGMIKSLNRHIVVCGYGRTGRAVVDVLSEHGAPFAVVELETKRCRDLEDRRAAVVQGDATQEAVLRAAGVDRAATLIMCLADDAHNVYAILLARQLNPQITIIARAVDDGTEERLRLAGADRVLNPYRVGGTRLAITVLKPTVVDFVEASLMGSSASSSSPRWSSARARSWSARLSQGPRSGSASASSWSPSSAATAASSTPAPMSASRPATCWSRSGPSRPSSASSRQHADVQMFERSTFERCRPPTYTRVQTRKR